MTEMKTIKVFAFLMLVGMLGTAFLYGNKKSPERAGERLLATAVSPEKFKSLHDREQLRIVKEMALGKGLDRARDFLKKTYPDEPADEHELIHMIGEAAFLKLSYKGFAVCDAFFNYGCYHGVIIEAIRQHGGGDEVLQNLAKGCLDLPANKTTITACVHGVGHGLMVLRSYDLLRAYQDCDRIFKDHLDLFYCYDGISMENVVRRVVGADSKNFLNSDNPLYPCNIVPQKYQPACVREHVHYVRREFYQKDTDKSASYCLSFDESTRSECFGGLGTALNQDNPDDPQKVIEECGKLDPRYSVFCLGTAASQYGFSKKFEYGVMLCRALSSPTDQRGCLSALEYVKSIKP